MNFLINRSLIWHVVPAPVRAWQETGGMLKLGNWGTSNKRTTYKCVKPATDGAVLGATTTPRLEGAGKEQLPEPAEVGVWGGSPGRRGGLRCRDAASPGSTGSQRNSILTLFPSSQLLPMTLISRTQPQARGQSTQVSPQGHRRMEKSRRWIWRSKQANAP